MSYSFGFKAADKAAAIKALQHHMDKVVADHPEHKGEATPVTKVGTDLIGMLQDDTTHDVAVSVSGSMSKNDAGVTNVSLNVSVGTAKRVPA